MFSLFVNCVGSRNPCKAVVFDPPAVFEAVDMPARRKNDKDWQKDVPTEDEKDILEEWVGFRQWEKDGHWRPLADIQSVPKIQDVHDKRDGLLALTAEKK